MATKNPAHERNAYDKIEQLVYGKIYELENENAQLRSDLALANAKLEVYERIATVTGSKSSLGFGPPIEKQ